MHKGAPDTRLGSREHFLALLMTGIMLANPGFISGETTQNYTNLPRNFKVRKIFMMLRVHFVINPYLLISYFFYKN